MNFSRRTFMELAGATILVAGTSAKAATNSDNFRQIRELTIDELIARQFPSSYVQGPAVPGMTECPKDLENYHPPRDNRALDYITRLCKIDGGSAFTLQGVSGWSTTSRALMASLVFTAKRDSNDKIYYEAQATSQTVAGYKLKSWRIDTQVASKHTTFMDVLTWTDSNGKELKTKWPWRHRT
jgi:hypothetical protein